jgi:hypothetical protein
MMLIILLPSFWVVVGIVAFCNLIICSLFFFFFFLSHEVKGKGTLQTRVKRFNKTKRGELETMPKELWDATHFAAK